MYTDLKILADIYGTWEGREGSWYWAVAIAVFLEEAANLESDIHFRPSESVPPLEEPQERI